MMIVIAQAIARAVPKIDAMRACPKFDRTRMAGTAVASAAPANRPRRPSWGRRVVGTPKNADGSDWFFSDTKNGDRDVQSPSSIPSPKGDLKIARQVISIQLPIREADSAGEERAGLLPITKSRDTMVGL